MQIARINHQDFGEKIGGAKKDLWASRGLLSSDLDDMNEGEIEKYLTKNNIWKKPDYDALVQNGIPAEVVFYIKTVRDALPPKPLYFRIDDSPEKRAARNRQYADTVKYIRDNAAGIQTKEDVLLFFKNTLVKDGYYYNRAAGNTSENVHYSYTDKTLNNPVIGKIAGKINIGLREYMRLGYNAAKQQFGVPKAEKIPKGYKVLFYDGGGYSKYGDWKANTFYIAKDSGMIIKQNIETREQAVKDVQEIAANSRKKGSGKQRFVPPQLSHIRREGQDFRHGIDISGQDYLNTFGFRGGEFGNWMSQNDRQASLNMGFDALKDLAAALKISDKDISYGGELAIAFGARGSGNAAAHYEPLGKVINLTKMKGAGSLAHEWWHGLDDFMGKQQGAKTFLTKNPSKHPLIKKLVTAMKYRPQTPAEAKQSFYRQKQQYTKNAESWVTSLVGRAIESESTENPVVLQKYEKLKTAFLKGEPGTTDRLSDFKKEVIGRVIPKQDREQLQTYERLLSHYQDETNISPGQESTDYYKNSMKMDNAFSGSGQGYWKSNEEMSARAFAVYVMDKLPHNSDYLVGHAESCAAWTTDRDGNSESIKAYPEGEERKAINAVFDEIIQDLKLEKLFRHQEKSIDMLRVENTLPIPHEDLKSAPEIKTAYQTSLFSQPNQKSVLAQIAENKTIEQPEIGKQKLSEHEHKR